VNIPVRGTRESGRLVPGVTPPGIFIWGIIKRERYYGKKFTSRESIVEMIENYIEYYNNKRLQRNLGVLTPMEKHEIYIQAA